MKIYLIRHCESEDDILDCYGGCADFDLTEKGVTTAKKHAKELTNLKIEKIFTSPYKRAKSVADIFNEQLHCGVEIIDNLREMNTYGVMSGVNKELAKKIFSLLLNSEKYKKFGYYNGIPFEGGEEVATFDQRIKDAFDTITSKNLNTVAIVTHGGVFRSVYKNILNKTEQLTEIDDVATIEIEYRDNQYFIISTKGITLK